jgi:hypothetical protein
VEYTLGFDDHPGVIHDKLPNEIMLHIFQAYVSGRGHESITRRRAGPFSLARLLKLAQDRHEQ